MDEETVKKSLKPEIVQMAKKNIGVRLRKIFVAHTVLRRRAAGFVKGGLPFAKQCAAGLGR